MSVVVHLAGEPGTRRCFISVHGSQSEGCGECGHPFALSVVTPSNFGGAECDRPGTAAAITIGNCTSGLSGQPYQIFKFDPGLDSQPTNGEQIISDDDDNDNEKPYLQLDYCPG